ncbi:MAG: PIG-L family deacetylase, partial [Thermus sp.]
LDRLYFYVVHGGLEWPLPKGFHPGLPLEPPPRGRHLPWRRLDLTPEEEQAKLQALKAHRSQMELLGRFMEAFVRKNELLAPYAPPP